MELDIKEGSIFFNVFAILLKLLDDLHCDRSAQAFALFVLQQVSDTDEKSWGNTVTYIYVCLAPLS